jgi:hypothetical protein
MEAFAGLRRRGKYITARRMACFTSHGTIAAPTDTTKPYRLAPAQYRRHFPSDQLFWSRHDVLRHKLLHPVGCSTLEARRFDEGVFDGSTTEKHAEDRMDGIEVGGERLQRKNDETRQFLARTANQRAGSSSVEVRANLSGILQPEGLAECPYDDTLLGHISKVESRSGRRRSGNASA